MMCRERWGNLFVQIMDDILGTAISRCVQECPKYRWGMVLAKLCLMKTSNITSPFVI